MPVVQVRKGDGVDIDVLGALDVREHGVSVTPTAPKPRQVLALLALHADQVVPVSALVDELWSQRPPRSARTTLQTYVLQLRELIAAALVEDAGARPGEAPQRTAKDVLMTLPGGYLLSAGQGRSDVRAFEQQAGSGFRAMDAGDFEGASHKLGAALDLWSGAPFADVQKGPRLSEEAERLEESRLYALEQRIEADMRLGRHRELIAELMVLTRRHPTHEHLHGQYVLALHRSGRRGEALAAYRELRTTLACELGIDPSPWLQHVMETTRLDEAPVTGPATGLRPPGHDGHLAPAI
jgi:DNA-binding SARP family transcriptional activator